MDIVYTVLGAIVCMILVISIDAGITKLFDEKSIMQKNYINFCFSFDSATDFFIKKYIYQISS